MTKEIDFDLSGLQKQIEKGNPVNIFWNDWKKASSSFGLIIRPKPFISSTEEKTIHLFSYLKIQIQEFFLLKKTKIDFFPSYSKASCYLDAFSQFLFLFPLKEMGKKKTDTLQKIQEFFLKTKPSIQEKIQKEKKIKDLAVLQRQLEKYLVGEMYREKILSKQKKDEGIYLSLLEEAKIWKKERSTITSLQKLNDRELKQLKKIACYPKYLEKILSSKEEKLWFFYYALHLDLPVQFIIQFPALIDLFQSSEIIDQLARGGKNVFRIYEKNGSFPCFQIKVTEKKEERLVSSWRTFSLEDSAFPTISFKELLLHFSQKEEGLRDFSIVPESGLIQRPMLDKLWEAKRKGKKFWENQDFYPYQYLNHQEMKDFFGTRFQEKKSHFIFCISAEKPDQLDIDGVHGWYKLCIYLEKQDQYLLIPMGKFPQNFPANLLSLFSFLGKTEIAVIGYPDWNEHATKRAHFYMPFALGEKAFKFLAEQIEKILEKSHKNQLIFQFAGDNCVYLPQMILEETRKEFLHDLENELGISLDFSLPNARVPITEGRPSNPILKSILLFVLKKEKKMREFLLFFLENFIFCFWRKKKMIVIHANGEKKREHHSVFSTGYKKDRIVYLPAQIFHLALKKLEEEHVKFHYGFSQIPKARKGTWNKKT